MSDAACAAQLVVALGDEVRTRGPGGAAHPLMRYRSLRRLLRRPRFIRTSRCTRALVDQITVRQPRRHPARLAVDGVRDRRPGPLPPSPPSAGSGPCRTKAWTSTSPVLFDGDLKLLRRHPGHAEDADHVGEGVAQAGHRGHRDVRRRLQDVSYQLIRSPGSPSYREAYSRGSWRAAYSTAATEEAFEDVPPVPGDRARCPSDFHRAPPPRTCWPPPSSRRPVWSATVTGLPADTVLASVGPVRRPRRPARPVARRLMRHQQHPRYRPGVDAADQRVRPAEVVEGPVPAGQDDPS